MVVLRRKNLSRGIQTGLLRRTWLPLGSDVVATGSTSSITDSISSNTRRFYRVRLMD
jgi:hypothetical protein